MIDSEQPMMGIYLDLDSIFDVKYSILEYYYPELARLVIEDGSYFKRTSDNFSHPDYWLTVTPTLMEILFKHRNKRDLARAKPTSIVPLLSAVVNTLVDSAQHGEEFRDIKFFVNTYPYVLTESEQANIAVFIGQFFRKYCEFDFHYLEPKEVTSEWIKNNDIEFMAMYNFLWWLELAEKKELFKVVIEDVRVMTPKLLNLFVSSKEEIEKMKDMSWESIEECCKIFVDLEFIDLLSYAPFEFLRKKESHNSTEA